MMIDGRQRTNNNERRMNREMEQTNSGKVLLTIVACNCAPHFINTTPHIDHELTCIIYVVWWFFVADPAALVAVPACCFFFSNFYYYRPPPTSHSPTNFAQSKTQHANLRTGGMSIGVKNGISNWWKHQRAHMASCHFSSTQQPIVDRRRTTGQSRFKIGWKVS